MSKGHRLSRGGGGSRGSEVFLGAVSWEDALHPAAGGGEARGLRGSLTIIGALWYG